MVHLSVAIPTFNGYEFIEELLTTLENQRNVDIEILVIDSSSTDGTWECVLKHSKVKAIQIDKSEFSHGGTRQLLVTQATGKYIAFLSQDALPVGNHWAEDILEVFNSQGESVVAVLGNQIPRKNAFPAIAQRIERTFIGLGNEFSIALYKSNVQGINRLHGKQPLQFLSDVHVAYRRDVILGKIPFEKVNYAEDQLMAKNLLTAGYDIAYAGFIKAIHSNDISLLNYAERIKDEIVGLHSVLKLEYKFNLKGELKQLIKNLYYDYFYLLRKMVKEKNHLLKNCKNFAEIPLFEIQTIRGGWLASRELDS